jgi:predicted dehydrogenase
MCYKPIYLSLCLTEDNSFRIHQLRVQVFCLRRNYQRRQGFFKGSPNEKVVLGFMGTNSRGLYLAQSYAKIPNVEIGYICDVDSKVVDKTIEEIFKITGKRPKGITDIRKMLEIKDIDAVVVAPPDHWHAPATIMACQAGKHVYVEKPCSHNPHEGEMAVEAAKKYNRLVQMGSQRRSFSNVQAMVKELHDGVIGELIMPKAGTPTIG